MNKRFFLIFTLSFINFIFFSNYVYSKQLLIEHNQLVIDNKNAIYIYSNNILVTKIDDAKPLDLKDGQLLYNKDNNIYLYNIEKYTNLLISEKAYNAMFYDEKVLFESDIDDSFLCKDLISGKNRSCYKLYIYELNTKNQKLINLNAQDTYLNDIEGEMLVYTSNHYRNEVCISFCSYLNVYNLKEHVNIQLNKYLDLDLNMSGNGFIDENIVYFESFLDIYDCQHTQIFAYDIINKSLEIITQDKKMCFNSNNEIIDVKNGYLLFSTQYNNYENSKYINNIYSYKDRQYDVINNNCKYVNNSIIVNEEINCLINSQVYKYPFDNIFPVINKDRKYVILKNEINNMNSKIDISDNLTEKESIKVEILSLKDDVGEQYITVKLCDRVNNCIEEEILIEIIEKDEKPPVIYCKESISVKVNSSFNINDYGYGNDEVDGDLLLEIESVDVSKKGTSSVVIKCVDKSGNVGYKEIEIIVYDDFNLYIIYGAFIFITIGLITIIYILRFKKGG